MSFTLDDIKQGMQYFQDAQTGGPMSFFRPRIAAGDSSADTAAPDSSSLPPSLSSSDVNIESEEGVKVLTKQVIIVFDLI